MAGRTIELYGTFALTKVAPYVDVVSVEKANFCCDILNLIFLTCGPHFSLESICSPSTLMSGFGSITVFPMLIMAFILNFLTLRAKCIKLYFAGAN